MTGIMYFIPSINFEPTSTFSNVNSYICTLYLIMVKKTGIVLMNLGSPDSTEVKDVKKYLKEFLMDERVIDMAYLNVTC